MDRESIRQLVEPVIDAQGAFNTLNNFFYILPGGIRREQAQRLRTNSRLVIQNPRPQDSHLHSQKFLNQTNGGLFNDVDEAINIVAHDNQYYPQILEQLRKSFVQLQTSEAQNAYLTYAKDIFIELLVQGYNPHDLRM